jgi:hypothetical protein
VSRMQRAEVVSNLSLSRQRRNAKREGKMSRHTGAVNDRYRSSFGESSLVYPLANSNAGAAVSRDTF